MKKLVYYLTLACILVSGITALLFVLISYKFIEIDPVLFTGFRIFNVILLLLLALQRKSLTVWILISIFAGAEFGYDLPEISKNMQFLSDIFHPAHQNYHRTADFCHAGQRNCRSQRPQTGWSAGLEIDFVFRGGFDTRSVHWFAGHQHQSGRSWVNPPTRCQRSGNSSQSTQLVGLFAEHVSRKHCQIGVRRKHSASGYFQYYLRNCAGRNCRSVPPTDVAFHRKSG